MEVPNYDGYYYIFDNGKISNGKKFLTPSFTGAKGKRYLTITAKKNSEGKRLHLKIHRLVAEAYIPNPDNLPCIDHKDRNKLNNDYRNLRWVSYRDNNLNKPQSRPNPLGHKYIGHNGANYFVRDTARKTSKGGFKTIEEAIDWRDKHLMNN